MKKARLESLDPKGIPLAEVIQVHKKFRPQSTLANNLGDGYLMTFNPLYREVRKEVLRRGFSFTTKNLGNYYSFPLMALDEVIHQRKIPYRENFSWLPVLEKRAPRTFTLSEIKRSEIQLNYLFHESAHCIAHHEFFGRKNILQVPKTPETLLKILLGESFANAVECLSVVYSEGEIGYFFLEGNCHFKANAKEAKILKKAVVEYGAGLVLLVLVMGFLYSNYLFEKLGKREREKVWRLVEGFAGELVGDGHAVGRGYAGGRGRRPAGGLARNWTARGGTALGGRLARREIVGQRAGALLNQVLNIGLQLDTDFRTNTTQLHLLKVGFPPNFEKMFTDPLDLLARKSELCAGILRLIRVARGN